MDLTLIVLGIVAANLITLLGGCVVAIRRSRRARPVDPTSVPGPLATPPNVGQGPAVKHHSD